MSGVQLKGVRKSFGALEVIRGVDLDIKPQEFAGRMAERLETSEKINDVQRQMLDAAARRPRDRDELADRLRRSVLNLALRPSARPWSSIAANSRRALTRVAKRDRIC